MNETGKFLKGVEIFSLLSDSEIEEVLPRLQRVDLEQGEALFQEGDPGETLYIVDSGTVEGLVRLATGEERKIASFGAGNFFGEMSVFERAPRSATCRANVESHLLVLKSEDFFHLIKHSPGTAIKIMYRMLHVTTERLQKTGEFLSDLVLWGEKARKRAITDQLTGIYNRRFLDDALVDGFNTARRSGSALSLIMTDLDHYRAINEVYGSHTADRLLVKLVGIVKHCLTKKALLARYGGDEFAIVLPETGSAEAAELAEAIRAAVTHCDLLGELGESEKPAEGGKLLKIAVSLGIATFPEHTEDLEELRHLADQALYRAKTAGRNRVAFATDAPGKE